MLNTELFSMGQLINNSFKVSINIQNFPAKKPPFVNELIYAPCILYQHEQKWHLEPHGIYGYVHEKYPHLSGHNGPWHTFRRHALLNITMVHYSHETSDTFFVFFHSILALQPQLWPLVVIMIFLPQDSQSSKWVRSLAYAPPWALFR